MTDFRPTHQTMSGTPLQLLTKVSDDTWRFITKDSGTVDYSPAGVLPLECNHGWDCPVHPDATELHNVDRTRRDPDFFEEMQDEAEEDAVREEEALRVASAQAYIRCDDSRKVLMFAVEKAIEALRAGNSITARAFLEGGFGAAKEIMVPKD